MSSKLNLIARMAARQTPEKIPAPETGLGAQIEALVADAVQQQVADALEQQPVRVQRLLDRQFKPSSMPTSFEQLPVVPTTPAPKIMQATIERDGAGLARAIVVNGQRLLAQRDGAGNLVGVISDDVVSEVNYNGKPVPPPNRRH
jgi:hypothetical protein